MLDFQRESVNIFDGKMSRKQHAFWYFETDWYKKDLFGLRSLDEAGKLHFETSPRGHCVITTDDLDHWVTTYILKPFLERKKMARVRSKDEMGDQVSIRVDGFVWI